MRGSRCGLSIEANVSERLDLRPALYAGLASPVISGEPVLYTRSRVLAPLPH